LSKTIWSLVEAQLKANVMRCPYCEANLTLAEARCAKCGALLEMKQIKKPLMLKAGIFLMRLNGLLILYCVASDINIANFDSFDIYDKNVVRIILIAVAILKLALAQMISNGINRARILCWVFVFWPHGSGSIHEMNMFVINHISLILLFLPPSNRWFRMAKGTRSRQA
jgi:DNA-directed RNA polymerase subunit RPC12/RpoP